MRFLKRGFWGWLGCLAVLWLLAEPAVFGSASFMALRNPMVQFTGVVAIGCMSLAMLLAVRPRWPEAWFGGLDKMYRMHKWLGVAALLASILHWLWAKGPKWAAGWGVIERRPRGAGGAMASPGNPLVAWLRDQRGPAEQVGQWAFYAAVILIGLALAARFPYRWFYKTHRLLAFAYLALAYHTLVLLKTGYWATPVGWLTALLLVAGTGAAVIVLLRRIGAGRTFPATISALRYFPGVRALEIEVEAPGWPGHKPGQFVFVTSDLAEGPHPYTIASGWQADDPHIRFVVKELGDHTRRLRERLSIGRGVTLEGPYGCFTFDDDRPHQIWIGAGIGITPFIGRMHCLAAEKAHDRPAAQRIDLFHATADVDEVALARLASDARTAEVQFHVLIDARDGPLTGERIRRRVPEWRHASIWFCGPTGFGEALRRDFARHGFAVDTHFHQELFAMR